MSSIFQDAIENLLSPVKKFLDDDSISEVMINGPKSVFVERSGKVESVSATFVDDESLQAAVRAIAQSVGRIIDENNPRLDARLPDGSRIAAVLPPLSKNGTTVAIRKFSKEKLTIKDLVSFGSLSEDAARFLDCCSYLGKNTVVSGGTGSGKTTLLNVLGSRIPENQRILVIEDAAELQINAGHVVQLETRKQGMDKSVEPVTIRELMESALRLRPDRIIVGEVRGPEALDLLNAMGTGHDGSMGTVHANTPRDCCIRLETLCLSGDVQIPPHVIRAMVSSTVQLVVQCKRYHDGSRRVSHISEVIGLDSLGDYKVRDIFRFEQTSRGPDGEIIGAMQPCGYLPSFFQEIVTNRLPFPKSKFKPPVISKAA